MKDTIKAVNGYSVKYAFLKCAIASHTNKVAILFDGEKQITAGEVKTFEEYKDEKENNECFVFYEKFTTAKGNEFIYWGDTEFGLEYFTKIEKAVRI